MSYVGAAPGLDFALGFEEVGRATLKILVESLNDEIEERTNKWDLDDLDLQSLLGGIGQVDVQPVDLEDFHDGPHPSVLKRAPERFPAVSVMSYFSQPVTSEIDQASGSSLKLAVEAFCVSGPVVEAALPQHETIVHRRILRTTEAINAVLMRERTLCGVVQPGITQGPRGGPGPQSFLRKEESGGGPDYIWQGSRLEYTLQRLSTY